MDKNVFVFRTEYINDVADVINNLGMKNDSDTKKAETDFNSTVKVGIYASGFNTIDKQLKSVSKTIDNVQRILIQQNDDMINLENKLKNYAEDIFIPTGYDVNDVERIFVAKQISTSKNDGRSVNEGQALYNIDEVAESSIKTMQNLGNIKNDFGVHNDEYDNSTVIQETDISNINNEKEQKEEKIDFDDNEADKKILQNIKKYNVINQIDNEINTSSLKHVNPEDISIDDDERV